ncbi:MAG: hypothetical protein IKP81_10120 [Paludibacteraceae bacterium]|nr:hypothetical protein [Paludibacteraceae bacterium]
MAYISNSDRILQAVISDIRLAEKIGYDPNDYQTINDALESGYPILYAIAKIIEKVEQGATDKEIYNEVCHYLENNIR